jgi:AcrR family transcriptional regulator
MNSINAARQHSVPETATMGLRERKQKLTKDAIWNAAIDLFAEKGFDDTTIDEIAEAAFVSRRSFFRYFESKSDLMAQPIANLANALTNAVESCPRSASIPQLFQHIVLALASEAAEGPRTAKVMEIAAKYPAAREALTSRMNGVQSQIEQAFRRRSKDTLMVQVLSSLTLSALSLTTHHWFVSGQKDIAASARKVFSTVAQVVCGLKGPNH